MPYMDYVRSKGARFELARPSGRLTALTLRWGECVQVLGDGRTAGELRVRVHGQVGYVPGSVLGGTPLRLMTHGELPRTKATRSAPTKTTRPVPAPRPPPAFRLLKP